jgi:alpha/beta superfamily hydrolase
MTMAMRVEQIPAGDVVLEAMIHLPENREQPLPGVVVCHPHPQYGGDMDNNVVMALVDALVARGIAALRFNFRGVGSSTGVFDGGRGEARDTAAALAFLAARDEVDSGRVGLAGYSFGAMMATAAMDERVRALALVSPPAQRLDRDRLAGFAGPLLMAAGDRDPICPDDALREAAAALGDRVELHVARGADHGWWGHERELGEVAGAFFARHLAVEGAK